MNWKPFLAIAGLTLTLGLTSCAEEKKPPEPTKPPVSSTSTPLPPAGASAPGDKKPGEKKSGEKKSDDKKSGDNTKQPEQKQPNQ